MKFYNSIQSKDIKILGIYDFDVNNWHNLSQLKNIYKSLFSLNEVIFFSFRREENLTDEKILKQLKVKILETFNSEGEYVILRQLDDARFDSVAKLIVKESTFDLLVDIWSYFYSCNFFIPKEEFTFSDFIQFQKLNSFQDIGNEKLLNSLYADFSCIKDLGGDSLIISYRNDYQLPDLKEIALNTPNINQVFR